MGGKKTTEDSRRFEKHRRDKLNVAFEVLCKLLPEYDPSVTLSKIEILRKAAEYIKHLQQQNDEVLKIGSDSVLRDECENLKKRVANLLIKTKELVTALRTAGVPLPINKHNSKNKVVSNQNLKDDKQLDIDVDEEGGIVKVRCGCMKALSDKAPLKEVNSTVAGLANGASVVAITPLSTLPTTITTSATEHQTDSRPILSSTLVLASVPPVTSTADQPCLPQTAQVITVPSNNPNGLSTTLQQVCLINNATVSPVSSVTTCSSELPNQTTVSSTAPINAQSTITNSTLTNPAVQNMSLVEKNVLPSLMSGTIILTDGRIVNVPQIVPQFVVKQPPTVILMPTTKKKEKLLMPKTSEVTKTTFANKAPIPAIRSFELNSGPKVRPKKRIKPILKRVEKSKDLKALSCEVSKKRKLEENSTVQEPQSDSNKTDDINMELPKTADQDEKTNNGDGGSDECSLINSEPSIATSARDNSTDNPVCLETISICNEGVAVERDKGPELREHTPHSQTTFLSDTDNGRSPPTSQSTDSHISEPEKSLSSDSSLTLEKSCSVFLEPKTSVAVGSNISPDKNLNDQVPDSLSSQRRVSLNDKCEQNHLQIPLADLSKSVSLEEKEEGDDNKTLANEKLAKNEKTKDIISNLPPCIISSTIQDSVFITTTKSIQLPNISSFSINTQPAQDSENATDQPNSKSIEADKAHPVDGVLGNPLTVQENNDSSFPILENSIQRKNTNSSTETAIGTVTNLNDLSVDSNSSVQASNELCSQETVKKIDVLSSSASLPTVTPVEQSSMIEKNDSGASEYSAGLSKENTYKQQPNCLPEPVQSKSLKNAFVQSSVPRSQDIRIGPGHTNTISQQTDRHMPASVVPPASLVSSEDNNEKNNKLSSCTNSDKNLGCDTTPFSSPANPCISAPNNMYSSYSSPYYSNETQISSHGTFPIKHLSTSSNILSDKIDGFGNINSSMSTDVGEKLLYSQNIPVTDSSHLKNSEWDGGTCSKSYGGIVPNMWDNNAQKQKPSLLRNMSKSSEKDNELSQKGYLSYQDPSSFNSNLFSNISANNSSLTASCSFADTPSLFSYHSSCSSATSSSYSRAVITDKNLQLQQTYNSNNSSIDTDKISDKHGVGYYPNNVPCNTNVSLPTTIPMYSGFVQSNVYGSYTSNNTPNGYAVSNHTGSVHNLSQTSTSLFNHNNSTPLPGITPTFTTPSDVFLSNKSKSRMSSVSSTSGFSPKSNSFVAHSLANNVTTPSSVPIGNDLSRNSGNAYTSSSNMQLLYGTPSSGNEQISSGLSLRVSSSLEPSTALMNNPTPACGLQALSSIETESVSLFSNLSVISSSNNIQPQANGYSTSASINKSTISSNRSVSGIYPTSFQPDTSNMFSNMTSLPISIPQTSGNAAFTTSVASNKMPVFTQVSASGVYPSSLQFSRPNLLTGVVSNSKPSYSNIPNSSADYSASLPASSSAQTNNSRTLSQNVGGVYGGSSQPGSINVFTSIALTSSPNAPYKLTSLSNSSNSVQNNGSSKSIQTNIYGMHSSPLQAEGMRALHSLPVQTGTLTSLSHSSSVYTSASSAVSTPKSGPAVGNEPYSHSQPETNSSFAPLPSKSSNHSNMQDRDFRNSSSFKQPNVLNDSNNYHAFSQNETNSTQYEQKNKNSSCLPASNAGSSNSSDQHLLGPNKKSVTSSGLSSSSSSPHNETKESYTNEQISKKTDVNQLNDGQRNIPESNCSYGSNKEISTHNYPVPISKDNSTSTEISPTNTRSSHPNNTPKAGNQQVNKKSSSDQESLSKSNESGMDEYNSSHLMVPSTISKKNSSDLHSCQDKAIQSNPTKYNGPTNSSNLNIAPENSKQISNTAKSMSGGINYNCNIVSSGNYSKNFQSQRAVPFKPSDTPFQSASYSNYNSSNFDSISNQFTNGTLPLPTTEGSLVCPSTNIANSGQMYGNINKIAPLDVQSETGTEKQNKALQKVYNLGNALKSDLHLDLLKSKDLEKNTFLPIGYEDVRIPTDFSSDLFSSLQVPSGGQHSESISPTAAFLLAFPLVSTSRNVESLHETENHENQTSTPTTILQIGNIDPPTTELFHPIDFQKNHAKPTDQFDINNEYLQLPDLNEKQNVNYKRCDKRKDTFPDYGKEIRSNKQKTKLAVPTSSGYSQSYSNNLMTCNEYQFCEKESSPWHQEFPANVSKEQKKTVDRKKDKTPQKGFYQQNYQDCFNYKDKKKKQQNRISVNWMSTPENREQTEYQPKEIEGVMAPPAQTVFTGISFDFPSESFPDLSSAKKTNNYSWSPSKSLLPSLDSHLMIPSTLPTLVGDLALGTNTPSESCKTFEAPKLPVQGTTPKKTPEKLEESKKRTDFSKSQANFFSVSQLVDPKSKKQKTNEKNCRRPDRQSKVRNNFGCPKRKEDPCIYYEEKNNFVPNGNQYHEKRNPYKGGSYSAESLIGAQSQELEFSSTFNYQQNTNYFQSDFSNNLEPANQQYGYLQQHHVGNFNHEDCQDYGFGSGQRNLETSRPKSSRKEDGYMRDGTGILPHLSSYPPYSKSLNYNLPPPSHSSHPINTNSTNTLTNFNLSTIFPEMNDQRGANTGQPQQPINQSFPNSQNYRAHLPH